MDLPVPQRNWIGRPHGWLALRPEFRLPKEQLRFSASPSGASRANSASKLRRRAQAMLACNQLHQLLNSLAVACSHEIPAVETETIERLKFGENAREQTPDTSPANRASGIRARGEEAGVRRSSARCAIASSAGSVSVNPGSRGEQRIPARKPALAQLGYCFEAQVGARRARLENPRQRGIGCRDR
jgi:hypothetical protein